MINTFGGRWYDTRWRAQLTSPAVQRAVGFYVGLVRRAGEPAAATAGFTECATVFAQGNAAMWYDATSAAGLLEDPADSKVVGKIGYAAAPVEKTAWSGWLYSWSLGIPRTTVHKDAAWKFLAWATSRNYIKLVGRRLGWSRVPPGSRAAGNRPTPSRSTGRSPARSAGRPWKRSTGPTRSTPPCSPCRTPVCSSWTSPSSRTWVPG